MPKTRVFGVAVGCQLGSQPLVGPALIGLALEVAMCGRSHAKSNGYPSVSGTEAEHRERRPAQLLTAPSIGHGRAA